MLEIVNCVKKRGSGAYIALFEAICQTNNAKRCDALHLLAAQLPFDYKPSQNGTFLHSHFLLYNGRLYSVATACGAHGAADGALVRLGGDDAE